MSLALASSLVSSTPPLAIDLFGCLPFLIAILRLEVCDVIIMLQFVIVSSYPFFVMTYQKIFWDIRQLLPVV